MSVRAAHKGEWSRVFWLSHDVASGISATRHIVECKRNPKLRAGTHFVLDHQADGFLATLTAYRFDFPGVGRTIGLANLFVPESNRHRGYGGQLLEGVLEHYEERTQRVFYLLSAIGPAFYEKAGFRELPIRYEAAPECLPMLRCPPGEWNRLANHRAYLRGLMAFID